MEIPAILKILVVFGSMLALARFGIPLGGALVLGGLGLHLWAGFAPLETVTKLGLALVSAELWLLLAITGIIIEIGRFMTEGKNADEIISAAQRWGGRHGHLFSLIAPPAVIGLVPMPAGALFSAPFVKQAGEGTGAPSAWKAAVNYWFRHIWEYWWPLYPGVIVAMSIFELETWKFVSAEFLYTPVSVLAGYFFLVRPHLSRSNAGIRERGGTNRRALFLLSPIMVTVVFVILFPFALRGIFPEWDTQLRKLVSVLAGLIAGLSISLYDELRHKTEGGGGPFTAILTRRALGVQFALVGVIVFKFMLEQSSLLEVAGSELKRSGIPLVCAVAALPFLAGIVSGIALGFAGASFPLVVGLMNTEGSGLTPLATLVLAYGFGYSGILLSPVHLCLLVSNQYFASSLRRLYYYVLPCVICVLVYAVASHSLLRFLGL